MLLEQWSPKIRETEMHVGTESGTDACFDQTQVSDLRAAT